jgi:ubiquinone/menaquinone biosynthesis C-methylase UbiE
MKDYGSDNKKAVQAKFDAQKLAFAPIMFQAAKALRDFGILEYLLINKKASVETISKDLNISVYGVKVLLEAGLSIELVMLRNNEYILTKTGYFMLSDELTRVNMDFTNDVNYLGFFKLQEAIKNGKPEGLKVFGNWNTVYEGLSELPEKVKESWFGFDHFYSDYAFPELMEIIFIENPKNFLDVGGNTGKFSLKATEFNENVKITILDHPGQTKVARENIKLAGLENRVSTIDVNLLDNSIPFPKGFDAIWMSQFLDCFSQEEIIGLLTRAYNALDSEGSLFILETYWDMQKYEASTYSLHATSLYFTAIANGNSQMYHSEDMLKLISKVGFKIYKIHENIGVSHTLIICKK